MIDPNMATMLGFVTTDANIESIHLQAALKTITDLTFNSITVDGDTSTNDMVLVMANGMAENNPLTPAHPDWGQFRIETLHAVSQDLAKMIAKDGEGATKLIEVEVNRSDFGYRSTSDCQNSRRFTACENGDLWLRCQLGKNYCGCWL